MNLSSIKLAIVVNAWLIDADLQDQIDSVLATHNRTVMYYWAPGFLPTCKASGSVSLSHFIGCPFADSGVGSLQTTMVSSNSSTAPLLPDGLVYGQPLSAAFAGILPRFELNETAPSECVVLGRYTDGQTTQRCLLQHPRLARSSEPSHRRPGCISTFPAEMVSMQKGLGSFSGGQKRTQEATLELFPCRLSLLKLVAVRVVQVGT